MSSCLRTLILLGCLSTSAAADGDSLYVDKVKPLLQERCFSCHGALAQNAGLRLDTARAILQGGDSGPAAIAGDSAGSLLISRITSTEESERMPPEGKPLTAEEIDHLRNWITSGGRGPDGEKPQPDPRTHWAFQKPVRPAVPQVRLSEKSGIRNPIDAFIVDELSRQQLEFVPEADRETLLRRVTLDLIGVPPTPGDLERFLADDAPGAYERLVDRLLADPRYGERWGRHWMDVWRYSDWYGRRHVPDVMNSYPHIWRWRDWIVRSLNADRGYDEMVLAMLAADEVFPGNDEEVVATGFLVRNWFKWNYESWMKDNVEHTGKAFLGLTLNCCQCHDHKYDPITQREYFQFRAFFEPLELRQDRVPGLPDPGPFRKYVYTESYGPIAAGLIRVFDEKLDAQTFLYAKGDARNRIEGEPPAVPQAPAVLMTPDFKVEPVALQPEAFYPGMKAELRTEDLAKADHAIAAATTELNNARSAAGITRQLLADARVQADQPPTAATPPSPGALLAAEQAAIDAEANLELLQVRVAVAEAQKSSLKARIAADDAKYRGGSTGADLAQAASWAERRAAWQVAKANLLSAEQGMLVAERNAVKDEAAKAKLPEAQKKLETARQAVDASRTALSTTSETYKPLSPVYPERSTGRRAALARWIANRANPLTARVAVNHLWMRHFGRGLVETPSNFGLNGKAPSHPQLLDWLAVELMDNGWQMKHLHRLMVTSRTYRSRSTAGGTDHPGFMSDPENRLYWRSTPRRMEAEVVRDSVLAAAGTLDDTAGGQELDHSLGLKSVRRSLYFASHGESQMQFLDLFDGPTPAECYQRSSSVVPQQALSLANSDLVTQQARHTAVVLWQECATAETDRELSFIRSAFRRILSRDPRMGEVDASRQFLAEQTRLLEVETLPETTDDPKAPSPRPADAAGRAREDFIHALFNHNDFVTIR
ncbi:Planctomycete cytochrome C [Caulifigura coniformis]|uniref:Planctomycete cytochrome C n=1 Tax=Caulifigura coniformis TaxID=2527983 RepID=A0A517SEY4_9PLAN|nr:DUF1553 domain-containing protein [Caulifigura coniformis]QDT54691.1 Planctomycete cytochrome C [Caulifigura coniformis]